jgi:hypothetical protein
MSNGYYWFITLGIKRPACKADNEPPPSAKGQDSWSYTSIPPIRLHGVLLNRRRPGISLPLYFYSTFCDPTLSDSSIACKLECRISLPIVGYLQVQVWRLGVLLWCDFHTKLGKYQSVVIFNIPKTEVADFSDICAHFYQSIRRRVPQDGKLILIRK